MRNAVDWIVLAEKCAEAGIEPGAFLREKLAELEERKRILITPTRTWYRDNAFAYDNLAERLLRRELKASERRVSKAGLAILVERRFQPEDREQVASDLGLKLRLLEEAGGRCRVCGYALSVDTLEIDHRLPLAEGGSNEVVNLEALCSRCNRGKADYFEETAYAAARPWWEQRSDLVDGNVRVTDVKRYCVLIRAGMKCERCGEAADRVALEAVLRVTKSAGGQPVYDNLLAVCADGCEKEEPHNGT